MIPLTIFSKNSFPDFPDIERPWDDNSEDLEGFD